MSTVAEINEAIPQLTTEELRAVERRLLREYRGRKVGILFDDAYGTLTEEDLRRFKKMRCGSLTESHPGNESSNKGDAGQLGLIEAALEHWEELMKTEHGEY